MSNFGQKIHIAKYYIIKYFNQKLDELKNGILKFIIYYNYSIHRKKIAIGTVFYTKGGVANHIFSLRKHSGYQPTLIPEVTIVKLIWKWDKLLLFKKYFKSKYLLKHNIIHSHVDSWFVKLCSEAQMKGVKWVHTYHTLYFEQDWDNGLEEWQIDINRHLLEIAPQADIKISISKWLQNYLKEKYGIDTIYIPNGVDINKCDKAEAGRFIEKYGITDFILFAGGFSDIKNPLYFIKLAAALPQYNFVMVRCETNADTYFKSNKIEKPDNLTIFGVMPHVDFLDALAACRLYVITSLSEGLPTTLMEAMVLEKPVVGPDTFGCMEVIHSSEYGYIYRHDSFDDLVEKTKLAYDDRAVGKNARRRVLENYDWKQIMPKIDAIYENLLQRDISTFSTQTK